MDKQRNTVEISKHDPHLLLSVVKFSAIPIALFFITPVIFGFKNLLKQRGKLIIMSNHRSLWDPIIADMLFYFRKVHFMAARDTMYTKSGLFSWFISQLGAFPVERNGGDTRAFEYAETLLKKGRMLMMTPEGRFNKTDELLRFHTGTARLALETNTPILPVYIDRIPALFHVTRIVVGERIDLRKVYGKDTEPTYEELAELSEGLRAEVAKLRDTYCRKQG